MADGVVAGLPRISGRSRPDRATNVPDDIGTKADWQAQLHVTHESKSPKGALGGATPTLIRFRAILSRASKRMCT